MLEGHTSLFSRLCSFGIAFFPAHSILNGSCTCGNTNCGSPGKHPRIGMSWKKVLTSSLDRLLDWDQKWEEAWNIACATGKLQRGKHQGKFLVVVDFDVPDHPLMKTMPATFSYKTGSGGRHFWFLSHVEVPNSASKIAPKVDIRGRGGYVIIPPSKHKSGNSYEFSDCNISDIAMIPDWILEKTRESQQVEKSPRSPKRERNETNVDSQLQQEWKKFQIPELREYIEETKIPLGVRNDTIFRLLCSDRGKGVTRKDELRDRAFGYREKCEDPETIQDSELESIVGSVMRYRPYNNSDHKKVLSSFLVWNEKQGNDMNEGHAVLVDAIFWSTLKKDEKFNTSLARISSLYSQFFALQGLETAPRYKPQLLARKLLDLGFCKKVTSKCNLWNIDTSLLDTYAFIDYGISNRTEEDTNARHGNGKRSEEATIGTGIPQGPRQAGCEPSEGRNVGSFLRIPSLGGVLDSGLRVEPPDWGPGWSRILADQVSRSHERGRVFVPGPGRFGSGPQCLRPESIRWAGLCSESFKVKQEIGNSMGETNSESTMKTVRVAVKEHPDHFKYGWSTPSMEYNMELMDFLHPLSPEETKLWAEKSLVLNPETVDEFIDCLKPDDRVGIGYQDLKYIGPCDSGHSFKLWSMNKETGDEVTLTRAQISCFLKMGRAQILYRDGKPFGVDEFKEINVKITKLTKVQEETSEEEAG